MLCDNRHITIMNKGCSEAPKAWAQTHVAEAVGAPNERLHTCIKSKLQPNHSARMSVWCGRSEESRASLLHYVVANRDDDDGGRGVFDIV